MTRNIENRLRRLESLIHTCPECAPRKIEIVEHIRTAEEREDDERRFAEGQAPELVTVQPGRRTCPACGRLANQQITEIRVTIDEELIA